MLIHNMKLFLAILLGLWRLNDQSNSVLTQHYGGPEFKLYHAMCMYSFKKCFCVVSCRVALRCVALCCVVLCCAVLCSCAVLYCIVWCGVLCCDVLCGVVWCAVLCRVVLCSVVLHINYILEDSCPFLK